MFAMTDNLERRGQEIARRRLRHGIRHATDFALRTGLDRKTIARAEAGEASKETLEHLELYLDQLDEEEGIDSKTPRSSDLEPGVVRFTIRGPGSPWEVETEARVENLAEVTRAVEEILRNMPRGE